MVSSFYPTNAKIEFYLKCIYFCLKNNEYLMLSYKQYGR